MGRAAEVARQIGWYWGTLMGDNHYRRYVEHRERAPGRAAADRARVLADAPRRHRDESQSALLLAGSRGHPCAECADRPHDWLSYPSGELRVSTGARAPARLCQPMTLVVATRFIPSCRRHPGSCARCGVQLALCASIHLSE